MRRRTLSRVTYGALALGLVAAIAGCGSGSNTTTTSSTAPAKTISPKGYQVAGTHGNVVEFLTPAHDTTCDLLGSPNAGVRCDVRDRKWTPPPKPKSCDYEWGQGLEMNASGAPQIVCGGDTNYNPHAKVLPNGQALTLGPFICSSGPAGATCKNEKTGRGWVLSSQKYEFF